MSDSTGIEWCDATFNPWIGCEKVSPGCAHCYAETLVTGRMGRDNAWGATGVRQRTSVSLWKRPERWERLALEGRLPDGSPNPDGHRPRVFCASLADVFEPRPELEPWRVELFLLIEATPALDWLILTKRPEFAREFLTFNYEHPLPNVWLGTSIENARHTYRADVLREIPAAVRFVSAEPLLGSLIADHGDVERVLREETGDRGRAPLDLSGIDWVIVGGESGPGARPMHPEWAREIRDACLERGCVTCWGGTQPCVGDYACQGNDRPAFFFKQWGEYSPGSERDGRDIFIAADGFTTSDPWNDARLADDRRQDGHTDRWRSLVWMGRRGKKRAGAMLDGRRWTEWPRSGVA